MVYVFKTSVPTQAAVKRIAPSLEGLSFIRRWNFDLDDCDRILRIEAAECDPALICGMLESLGFSCVELQ